jgi:hypothetical protein
VRLRVRRSFRLSFPTLVAKGIAPRAGARIETSVTSAYIAALMVAPRGSAGGHLSAWRSSRSDRSVFPSRRSTLLARAGDPRSSRAGALGSSSLNTLPQRVHRPDREPPRSFSGMVRQADPPIAEELAARIPGDALLNDFRPRCQNGH